MQRLARVDVLLHLRLQLLLRFDVWVEKARVEYDGHFVVAGEVLYAVFKVRPHEADGLLRLQLPIVIKFVEVRAHLDQQVRLRRPRIK